MTVKPRRQEQDHWVWDAVRAHERRLIRYTTRILRDRERAKDVVQEAFIRLCREPGAVSQPRVLSWLYTVCRNRARDVMKKEQRMIPLDDAAVGSEATATPGPSKTVAQREEASQVLEAMSALSARQEEVLRLRFQGGLSNREISEVTGLSKSNVGFLIHKGLTSLRTKFAQRRVVEQRS